VASVDTFGAFERYDPAAADDWQSANKVGGGRTTSSSQSTLKQLAVFDASYLQRNWENPTLAQNGN